MPISLPWRQHPWRWVALAIALALLALLVTLAVHVNALLQPARFTDLLERELASVGIELKLQAPATPALFPRPAVRLQGFSLSDRGDSTPILAAAGATIVVPWWAVLHDDVAVQRVEIDSPTIDLGELRTLLARLPHHRGPPHLPTIAAGVHMRNGTLDNHGAPLLFEVSIDTGELRPGRLFHIDASAHTASGRMLTASVDTVPAAPRDGAIAFNPIELRIARQNGIALQLAGTGNWKGGESLTLDLHGTLQHAALAPPPASPAPSSKASAAAVSAPAPRSLPGSVDQVTLKVSPARPKAPLTLTLVVAGKVTRADFSIQPAGFGTWWKHLFAAAPSSAAGPLPINGRAEVKKLDLGWLKATDISIEASPGSAPASAVSTAPAPSASR